MKVRFGAVSGPGPSHLAEELEGALGEGEEVDEEDNAEGSEIPRGEHDRVAQHPHPLVELQHLKGKVDG